MTDISDEEWEQLLKKLSQHNDLSTDFTLSYKFSGLKLDLIQASVLQFITTNSDEQMSTLTTKPIIDNRKWMSARTQDYAVSNFKRLMNDIHLLIKQLQHE
jgi:hypothetical protein